MGTGALLNLHVAPEVELAIVLVLAAVLGIVLRLLKQPLILSYLLTGIIIGALRFPMLADREFIEVLSTLGIMFLLFLVGLEMDYESLRKMGKLSLAIGLGQVFFTSLGGFLIAYFFFNFAFLPAIYIAVALTFSSTVIIVKLLSDKKALTSLHGRAAVGLLLVQDLVVVLILIALNALEAGGEAGTLSFFWAVLAGVGIFILMLFLGRNFFPYLFYKIARSQELLFLVSLAWLLAFAVIVKGLGFSIEIAGFLGGVALANSSEKYHIANKVRPLRDFFLLIFFALLGTRLIITDFEGLLLPAVIFSLFVLLGNPLIVMAIMGFMRYTKRTGFLTGVTVAQISEFSLIFAALGLAIGHITDQVFALIAAVGVITITLSTYLILYAERIFPHIAPLLSFFERRSVREERDLPAESKEIILIGGHRTGRGIMNHIDKEKLLVIDFDPLVSDKLKFQGVAHLFADIKDPHLFEDLNLEEVKIIISTSPHLEDNLTLVERAKSADNSLCVIVRAETEEDALSLYRRGADYVLLPQFLSGEHLGRILGAENSMEVLERIKAKEIEFLKNK